MQAHTLINPHAMVIELFDTLVTETAVFGTGRFRYITSDTPGCRTEQDVVMAKALHRAFKLCLICIIVQIPWVDSAGLVVAPIGG